ncbi:MAG: glutamate-5-semialdehyde dehydrogenase [Candidatus Omnitrophica bacterium]|nr:glutamate-5-semialdehyde dehydrogenase [Candidatus Omnitrophota bacterium]
MALDNEMINIAKKAKEASRVLATLDADRKNSALKSMARNLIKKKAAILKANRLDVKNARRKGLSAAMLERLTLNDKRLKSMADGLRTVASLKDEVGVVYDTQKRPNGLWICKMRVPIGVIAIIYESRPNVTSDCVGLCLKSGNSIILRGGSEAINSNIAIYDILNSAAKASKLPDGSINMVKTTDRKAVGILLKQADYIDLVMPRGGEGLIREVVSKSRIPVIKHYKGICHVYVDRYADINMAHRIAVNAKVQRPGVCNAMETLLVHNEIAPRFLPVLVKELQDKGVEVRGCQKTRAMARGVKAAKENDWSQEYLDLILAVKVVSSLDEAIGHIARYGSMHSDTIVTDNYSNAMKFLRCVDSSSVYLNASTRFTDGGEFGMGAEIGISTDKLHARGPMGLHELTSYKYVIFGNGQIRT